MYWQFTPKQVQEMDRLEEALREYSGSLRFNREGLLYLKDWGFTLPAAERAAKDLAKAGRVTVEVERVLHRVQYTWHDGSVRKTAKGSAIFPEIVVRLRRA